MIVAKNGKKLSRAAALLCAAVIGASAFGLKLKDPSLPDPSPFSETPENITAQIAADTGYAQALNNDDSKDSQENVEDSLGSLDSSRLPEDMSSDGGEKDDSSQNDDHISNREYYYNTYYVNGGGAVSGGSSAVSSSESNSAESSGDSSENNQLADDGSHADTPGNKPTDGGDTDIEYFTTDISDGETVESEQYAFKITHLQKRLTVKRIDVSVNGAAVPWTGEVTLSAENGGENRIRIAVTYADKDGKVIAAYKEYTVYLKKPESQPDPQPQAPELKTDLSDHTRSDANLQFFAYVSGEVQDTKLTVYCKNNKLKADGTAYSCTLDMGINKIRITAEFTYEGERQEIYREFDIRLIAETTPETAPYLAYHNVPDTVRGSLYTLDLAPRDYNGNTLYYSNLYVRLNGVTVNYSWDGEYTSYLLDLTAGENTLDIRVTDNEGRYTDYSFVITCLAAQEGEVIGYASLEMDANVLGLGVLLPEMQIEIRQGESAAQSIVRALEESGFTVEGTGDFDSGYYIARIGKSGIAAAAQIDQTLRGFIESDVSVHFSDRSDPDSLGEKDHTTGSGWMISVNGHYTSYGTSDLHLKDGDKLRLRFTLAYGKDIGANFEGNNYDVCY